MIAFLLAFNHQSVGGKRLLVFVVHIFVHFLANGKHWLPTGYLLHTSFHNSLVAFCVSCLVVTDRVFIQSPARYPAESICSFHIDPHCTFPDGSVYQTIWSISGKSEQRKKVAVGLCGFTNTVNVASLVTFFFHVQHI